MLSANRVLKTPCTRRNLSIYTAAICLKALYNLIKTYSEFFAGILHLNCEVRILLTVLLIWLIVHKFSLVFSVASANNET